MVLETGVDRHDVVAASGIAQQARTSSRHLRLLRRRSGSVLSANSARGGGQLNPGSLPRTALSPVALHVRTSHRSRFGEDIGNQHLGICSKPRFCEPLEATMAPKPPATAQAYPSSRYMVMPLSSLGKKSVDFCGITSPAVAMCITCSTSHGFRKNAICAPPSTAAIAALASRS
jgi:hypothetical protein